MLLYQYFQNDPHTVFKSLDIIMWWQIIIPPLLTMNVSVLSILIHQDKLEMSYGAVQSFVKVGCN